MPLALYTEKGIIMDTSRDPHWGFIAYFGVIHLGGIIGTWYASQYASSTIVWFAIAYFFIGHLAITCGAHRLYAHESYRASTALQYFFVLAFSAVAQGPITWWVGKHRQHHSHTDKEDDPHSPKQSFFHGHMGWLLTKGGRQPSPPKYMHHFQRDGGMTYRPALWQRRHQRKIIITMAALVPAFFGVLVGDVLGGILVGVFARLMWQYHLTWIVNSAGHRFGTGHGESATNIWLLALPTVGESFHANHHKWPLSYRLGRHWWQPDPGFYLIKLCMWLGLAHELEQKPV